MEVLIKQQEEQMTMRQQIADIVDYIDLGSIAEDYFNKSGSWLYKKVKGQGFNPNTPGGFTPAETEQLRSALLDLAERIRKTAIAIK